MFQFRICLWQKQNRNIELVSGISFYVDNLISLNLIFVPSLVSLELPVVSTIFFNAFFWWIVCPYQQNHKNQDIHDGTCKRFSLVINFTLSKQCTRQQKRLRPFLMRPVWSSTRLVPSLGTLFFKAIGIIKANLIGVWVLFNFFYLLW